MWNPSLRKTLSHPSAVHKKEQLAAKKKKSSKEAEAAVGKEAKNAAKAATKKGSGTNMATPCLTGTSKSVRLPSKTKERAVSGLIHDSTNEAANSRITSTSSLASSSNTNNNNNNMQLNVDEKPILSTSPSKHKRSFIDGFKTSFKFKRSDFLGTGGGTSSAMASHSFDSSTAVSKKTSLTSDHLNKMNPSIRRWSESAPRDVSTSPETTTKAAATGNNSANKDL